MKWLFKLFGSLTASKFDTAGVNPTPVTASVQDTITVVPTFKEYLKQGRDLVNQTEKESQ